MKTLTKPQIKLLKESLDVINKAIIHYKDYFKTNEIYSIGYFHIYSPMCYLVDRLTLIHNNRNKIHRAFKNTKPNNDTYWYPITDIKSRVDHLKRIKKHILKTLNS